MVQRESTEDKEYREKSTRHMFRAALYNSVGMASFFGLLGNVVGMVLKVFSAETMAASATASGILGVTPLGWAVIGGLMAVGVAATYMAQIESTKLKEVQDDALARKNAQCLTKESHSISHAKENVVEYEQNRRADEKTWQESIGRTPAHISTQIQ